MKADRLLAILSMLQAEGRVTVRKLAEKLEVSERTVRRDMESLSMAGIPVIAERGYQGGWFLPEGYRNRLTGLTADEISALLLLGSSSVVKDLGLTAGMQGAFRKLLSALPDAARKSAEMARQRIHIDGAEWRLPPEGTASPEHLAVVQQAVWENRKLRIRYRALEADADKERIAAPLGLIAKKSVWYMAAIVEDDIRTYRISRLIEVTPLEQFFERPEGFDLAAYWEQSIGRFQAALPRYPAVVRIAAEHWPRFARERYVYIQKENQPVNGWLEAEVEFHTLDSACSILLSYGRHAAAIEPPELRDAVRAEVRALDELYGGENGAGRHQAP